MFGLWEMVKGRVVGAVVGWILMMLAGWGITELTPAQVELVNTFVSGTIAFVGFLGYSVWHIRSEKKKLDKGQVVPERVESVRK